MAPETCSVQSAGRTPAAPGMRNRAPVEGDWPPRCASPAEGWLAALGDTVNPSETSGVPARRGARPREDVGHGGPTLQAGRSASASRGRLAPTLRIAIRGLAGRFGRHCPPVRSVGRPCPTRRPAARGRRARRPDATGWPVSICQSRATGPHAARLPVEGGWPHPSSGSRAYVASCCSAKAAYNAAPLGRAASSMLNRGWWCGQTQSFSGLRAPRKTNAPGTFWQ